MAAALTLAFVDGFDAYNAPNGSRKWTTGTNINTSSSGTRHNAGRKWTSGAGAHQFGTNFAAGQICAAVQWDVAATSAPIMQVLDSAGAAQLSLMFVGGNVIQVRRGGIGGTILATSTIPRFQGVHDYVEFGYLIGNGTGAYRVAVNGALDLNATGVNTQGTGITTWGGFAGDASLCDIDDWIVKTGAGVYDNTDDFWGDRRVSTLFANGTGDVTQWLIGAGAGSNWQQVDEVLSDDDTTFNASDVVGALDLYQIGDLIAGATDIRGVQVNIVAKRENSGTPPTRTMQVQARSNGVDSLGAAVTLSSTYANYRHLMLVDPSGGAAFTKARVDALQIGQLLAA